MSFVKSGRIVHQLGQLALNHEAPSGAAAVRPAPGLVIMATAMAALEVGAVRYDTVQRCLSKNITQSPPFFPYLLLLIMFLARVSLTPANL